MNVKPLSTLQRVLTTGLARARLECASSAACPCLLLITLKFHQAIPLNPNSCSRSGSGIMPNLGPDLGQVR